MPRDCCTDRARRVLPVLSMAESEENCQRRFQAAVDVIQNLPKNGAYRPSYEVMLRFYGLYKQAVCGPCRVSRPGFWDPVGRYKWDAWSRLGEMSSSAAMMAYVEEMKKVAQEVIDTMPMNEKTASLFHYFEPLYLVIHDMPRPPEALLSLRAELEGSDHTASPSEVESEVKEEPTQGTSSDPKNAASADGLVVTSDSESEVFCDSLEQLDQNKGASRPGSLHSERVQSEPSCNPMQCRAPISRVTQVGAGQGGEGSGEGRGAPMRGRGSGREMRQGRREETRGEPLGSAWRAARAPSAAGGGDGWEGGPGREQDAQLQQQIVLALRRLREDMHSVMERLQAVERLAAAQAQSSDWTPAGEFTAPATEEAWWWPFDVSGRTMLLLLLWPFVAQGLVFLLRRSHRKSRLAA
ncbi:acyl-CoA-binding domain-containing protein 4 isoform X1 [Megalops cyprinoides]|uniref:acyl-CoA-binding domain-containing protein 4 isoform X1 n=1 Tax=Megalops cyprinoides TaxID=118141 RepID=UPI001863C998|nr:acyl-CoA-binding domain-containing protein 4 isoform X1 [Megalops cyprinoides]